MRRRESRFTGARFVLLAIAELLPVVLEIMKNLAASWPSVAENGAR